jgi:hypothetical protein
MPYEMLEIFRYHERSKDLYILNWAYFLRHGTLCVWMSVAASFGKYFTSRWPLTSADSAIEKIICLLSLLPIGSKLSLDYPH